MSPDRVGGSDEIGIESHIIFYERTNVGQFFIVINQKQNAVFCQMRSQRKGSALQRPHRAWASGRRFAADKINIARPGVRKIVVLGFFYSPFQPAGTFIMYFIFAGIKIYTHFFFCYLAVHCAASASAEFAAISVDGRYFVKEPVYGSPCSFLNRSFHITIIHGNFIKYQQKLHKMLAKNICLIAAIWC